MKGGCVAFQVPLMTKSLLATRCWTPKIHITLLHYNWTNFFFFRNHTYRLCAVDGSICVASGEFRQQSSHHTRNMNATWCQGAISGAWAQNIASIPMMRVRELPCKVVLFLESLITVDTGEGTMKGAGFMSGDMRPILACHLKETHEDKGNG